MGDRRENAHTAGLRAGLPDSVPGVTINRFCSSGLQSIAMAADRIRAGSAGIIIAGWPGSVAWALGLLIGINLFMSGVALVMTAIACRSVSDASETAAPVRRTT